MYKIGRLAALAKISVRALHHYDEIGLVKPSARTRAGYRVYAQRDLERLQHVLFLRELGLGLEPIARVLDDPKFDRSEALRAHRRELVARAERTKTMIALVDRALFSIEEGEPMQPKEMFSAFEEEAKARWGRTDAWRESARRAKTYGKDEWARIAAEAAEISAELAKLARAGVAATDARAMDLAERHREHIDRWFYACSREMHAGLGEMYVADDRFAQNYEKVAKGLARYIRDAIVANASRA